MCIDSWVQGKAHRFNESTSESNLFPCKRMLVNLVYNACESVVKAYDWTIDGIVQCNGVQREYQIPVVESTMEQVHLKKQKKEENYFGNV